MCHVVTSVCGEGGSSNVYIPAQIADPSLIMQGDVVEVRAHWNQRNSNWRAFGECLRDGAPVPGREMNSAAMGAGAESPASSVASSKGGAGGQRGGQAGQAGQGQAGQAGQAGQGTQKGWMTNYKTRICKNWQMGTCQYGNKCTFAHGAHPSALAGLCFGFSFGSRLRLSPSLQLSVAVLGGLPPAFCLPRWWSGSDHARALLPCLTYHRDICALSHLAQRHLCLLSLSCHLKPEF